MSTVKSKTKVIAPRANDSDHTKSSLQSQKNAKISSVRNPAFASTRSAASMSAFKKGAQADKSVLQKPPVQIFDDLGNDVTPLPLTQIDPTNLKKTNLLGDGSVGTPTDLMSQATASIYGQGTQGTATSVYGGGPFTRSVFTQSYEAGSDSLVDESGPNDITFTEIRHKRQEIQEVPTEADLEKIVDITLTETETFWMFDLPDVKVSTESEEVQEVEKRNKIYSELLKGRVGNDLYVDRGMNTFNEPPKLKSVQTNKIELIHTGVECTHWDMYDTYRALEKEKQDQIKEAEDMVELDELEDTEDKEDDEGTISQPGSPKLLETTGSFEKGDGGDVPLASKSSAKIDSEDGRAESRATGISSLFGSEIQLSLDSAVELTEKEKLTVEWEDILKSDKFYQHLFLLERVVNLNTYQNKQALYRGFQPVVDYVHSDRGRSKDYSKSRVALAPSSIMDMGPNLDRLWSYTCYLTKDKNVSCMAWNRVNQDLLAVGYGQWDFIGQKPGLVCCWCIKNPEFPERVFLSKEGVTAVDFSAANPNLLAVGYYDGGIAVYNVRRSADEPVLDNFTALGKHLAPIWQLKWIEKERGAGEDKIEVLISISTDGRVTQWSIRKGFESYDVMKLKKMPTRMAGRTREKKGEAFISRYAGGMCFDFHLLDSNIYLVGTEDGYVHRCSCSHNEQYLESYLGHHGPVYSIQWSPFASDIFLTCSADWTIKLWHQEKTKPVLSFHSSTKAVNDICWSPWSSTVFASVNESAVEVWDLSQSTLDPVYVLVPTSSAKQTSLTFSKNSQCLMVGDSDGQVTVYQLRSMPAPPINQTTALLDVIKSSLASQLSGAKQEEPVEPEDSEMEDPSFA